MSESRIHSRYAKALFDLAEEKQIQDLVFADMELIEKVCVQNKDFNALLSSPIIETQKKKAIFNEIFAKHIQPLSISFLYQLIKKKRENLIRGISASYINRYKESKGILTAKIQTAHKFDSEYLKQLTDILEKQTGKKIEIIQEIKPELVGGFIITIDDKQLDKSILNKLQRLRKEFNGNIYEKGF